MDHSAPDNERPAKRPCLSNPQDVEIDAPENVPEDFDLPTARAQNDSRLKSLFEGIFAKYSHDFTDVGDEIDLETGDIVVNNGHLLGLQGEDDTGCQPRSWLFQAGLDESENPAGEDDGDVEEEEETGSRHFASSPRVNLPDTLASDALPEVPPSDQQHDAVDDSLDFVFTFKASGATGLSPVTKYQYSSHSTNTVNYLNPSNPPNPLNPPSSLAASKPADPIWAVPDLPEPISTPNTVTRKINVGLSPFARSPSPPGSGSVWAVRGRGRPRTEAKPKATPSRRKAAAKRKYHSSPVTADWSFAAVPDGNESDDPLQEFEPSPSPSKMRVIRGKRQVPTKDSDGSSVQPHSTPSRKPSIKRPKKDAVVHNDENDRLENNEMEIHEKEEAPGPESQDDMAFNSTLQGETSVIANIEDNDEEGGKETKIQGEEEAPALETQDDMASNSTLQGESAPNLNTKPSAQPLPNTPSKRGAITPDEAKSIVRMMHKEDKKASEVTKIMPNLDYQKVWHWFYSHWTRRLTSPPHLSVPWSHSELATFSQLSSQSDLTWTEIQRKFPSRSRAEVEFQLLRAFVDEDFVPAEDADCPVERLDGPTKDQEPDSSQEVWVQAEEIKAESESESDGVIQSIEENEVHGDSVVSSPITEVQAQFDVRDKYSNRSFVANSLLGIFMK
jgi:hypothetical protein